MQRINALERQAASLKDAIERTDLQREKVEHETAHIVQHKDEELRALKIKVGPSVGFCGTHLSGTAFIATRDALQGCYLRAAPHHATAITVHTPFYFAGTQMDQMAEDFSEMMNNTLSRMTQEVKVAIQSECLPGEGCALPSSFVDLPK